jgi:transposase
MGQITVFSGPERRRRWSEEERVQILTEAFSPGACVAEVARRHDVSTALIYTWRSKMRRQAVAEPDFAEAVVVAGDGAEPSVASPVIIVDLARGCRVSIFASAPAALAAAALKALR